MCGVVQIKGLKEVQVGSFEDTLQCLSQGARSRTTGATAMNDTSSRSHAIFTIHVEKSKKDDVWVAVSLRSYDSCVSDCSLWLYVFHFCKRFWSWLPLRTATCLHSILYSMLFFWHLHAENPAKQTQDLSLSHFFLLWTPHLEFTPARPLTLLSPVIF